jgi:formate/nitrite transporter FocA (FNT family)
MVSTEQAMSGHKGLDAKEEEQVEEKQAVRAPVLYETIRRRGEDELARPGVSLWWSGVAAGIAISASVYCEAYLRLHIPDAPWRPLVENFGYTVGFIIVILGGFQLFTEQTITAILPLFSDWNRKSLWLTARLWSIVFVANLAGGLAAAAFGVYSPATPPEHFAAFTAISNAFVDKGFINLLFLGVPAGFLIAALSWTLPNSEGSKFWVIFIITYVISLGGFAHVVAGAVEVFIAVLTGHISLLRGLAGAILPTLLGNILGGTALFSLIAYAQVREEM